MYRHILIATDGSELSMQAVAHGVALAKAVNARMTGPFHVLEPALLADTPETYRARMATLAAKHLEAVQEAAAASAVSCDVVHVEHDQPYQAIIDTAGKNGCDLIVMASHGRRGLAAIVLGSETVKVLTHSTIPVLVCHPIPGADSLFGRFNTLTVL
jgi:nucleotide-binding universal stress UspA family protein